MGGTTTSITTRDKHDDMAETEKEQLASAQPLSRNLSFSKSRYNAGNRPKVVPQIRAKDVQYVRASHVNMPVRKLHGGEVWDFLMDFRYIPPDRVFDEAVESCLDGMPRLTEGAGTVGELIKAGRSFSPLRGRTCVSILMGEVGVKTSTVSRLWWNL